MAIYVATLAGKGFRKSMSAPERRWKDKKLSQKNYLINQLQGPRDPLNMEVQDRISTNGVKMGGSHGNEVETNY